LATLALYGVEIFCDSISCDELKIYISETSGISILLSVMFIFYPRSYLKKLYEGAGPYLWIIGFYNDAMLSPGLGLYSVPLLV
jgi:hypothetical protein